MLTTMADKGNVDLHYKNKYGASFLHIAAQKNQPLSLYFFYSRGVDINVTDLFDFTPLHWACHCKSDFALTYIMAMSPNLEAKSKSNPIYKQINGAEGGFTPLHIAVCQA